MWESLYNENDLSDFDILKGTADYEVKDRVLIGISEADTPNTFLATKKEYGDFILEFEVWADTLLNSGVQIRSHSIPEYLDGTVHGYQIEIESSDRKWAGGIYEEGRRGWLYPLENIPKAQDAFNRNEWNKYKIEAIGNSLKTWVNGIQCTHLIDSMDANGFIAFQVHGIQNEAQVGKSIKWKNIKILTKDIQKYKTSENKEVITIDLTKDGVDPKNVK